MITAIDKHHNRVASSMVANMIRRGELPERDRAKAIRSCVARLRASRPTPSSALSPRVRMLALSLQRAGYRGGDARACAAEAQRQHAAGK